MIVPTDAGNYGAYAAARPGLALPNAGSPNGILPLGASPLGTPGQTFGFHPNMPELVSLYNSNKLAVVTNVGPLVTPMKQSEYMGNSKPKPYALFSHSDQVQAWESGRSDIKISTGWGGRAADAVADCNAAGRRVPDDHVDRGLLDLLHRPEAAALDRHRLPDERPRPERLQRLHHGRRAPRLDGLPAHDRHGRLDDERRRERHDAAGASTSARTSRPTRRSTRCFRTRAWPTS